MAATHDMVCWQVAGEREHWERGKEKHVERFLYFQDVERNQHKISSGFVLQILNLKGIYFLNTLKFGDKEQTGFQSVRKLSASIIGSLQAQQP